MPTSHIDNTHFMRNRHFHPKMNLPSILHKTGSLLCSNPLDKIYAMLAMPQFATMNPPWKVDYSKTKLQWYCEVATRCLLKLKSLAILSFVQHIDGIDEAFPSWVPQWDQEMLCNPIGKQVDYKWNAGRDSSVS